MRTWGKEGENREMAVTEVGRTMPSEKGLWGKKGSY